MKQLAPFYSMLFFVCSGSALTTRADDADDLRTQAATAMRRAAEYFSNDVATHGGYVYYYSLDLKERWGEGVASPDQIWVQPPGTPTVGMAFLRAYEATGEKFYLDAATAAAKALVYGQLESGGWTNCIDFDPRGNRVAQYRSGKGRGKSNSTLDDGISQAAIGLQMRVDQALGFKDQEIHEAAAFALDTLLKAQIPNGAFPQVWTGPVSQEVKHAKANYPDYDWRTEGRIKNYWDMYTLNDNVAGNTSAVLRDAYAIHKDEKYKAALARLGDFLILAQMPDPQPAWAQQYDYEMRPIWARKFEPAAISGGESQDVMRALMDVYEVTGDARYLAPIPAAIRYLRGSMLEDGRLARYYELKTNKPLFMSRRGDTYTLTYDDANLPDHYGWKVKSRLDQLENRFNALKRGDRRSSPSVSADKLAPQVRRLIAGLDDQGRWVSTYSGEGLTGQPKFARGRQYLSSELFARNIETLAAYLQATR